MRTKGAEGKMKLILARLKKKYAKKMETSLDSETPWELLVATVLSQRTQDAQVNKITPTLFSKYNTPKQYAVLTAPQLYKYVNRIGLYKGKAKNIINTAKIITREYHGAVPETMDELLSLPGVGRKTANVVLSNAFGKLHGIAIDTHCITVANRLFLLKTTNAEKIEKYIMGIVPQNDWRNVSHLFIALGRDVCTAKNKYCERCVLNDICPSSDA